MKNIALGLEALDQLERVQWRNINNKISTANAGIINVSIIKMILISNPELLLLLAAITPPLIRWIGSNIFATPTGLSLLFFEY